MRAAYVVSWKVGPNLRTVTSRVTVTPSGFVLFFFSEVERKEQGLGSILSGYLQY